MSKSASQEVVEFAAAIEEEIRERRVEVEEGSSEAGLRPLVDVVTDVFIDRLGELLPDLENVGFAKKKLGGKAYAQVNAWGISEHDGAVHLAVTVQPEASGDGSPPRATPGSVRDAVKYARHARKQAAAGVHQELEESSAAWSMFSELHAHDDPAETLRVVVFVNGLVDRDKAVEGLEEPGFVDVYDLERLSRICSSGLAFEEIPIDLAEMGHAPIEVVRPRQQGEDHEVYLAVLPGQLLADLYERWGARLLELNVRSFLQARGKVNKGIRDTLRNQPEYFLAYNNGLTVTVASLEIAPSENGGLAITHIKGLQIVNGGQTTASIHRAGKVERVDLSKVGVQAKITRVDSDRLDELVPLISRYSNTQNKVNETDFSANHPFHVELEQLSQKIWIPGETSRWFYERARGQWEVARAREGTTPAKKRQFDVKCPRKQRIDKSLLARSENTWDQKPHMVSRGGQKNFVAFMGGVGDTLPDEQAYRDLVSRVILFKEAESVARRIGFSAYRANAVTYTVALLSYRTARGIDLGPIWEEQSVPEGIRAHLEEWMEPVHRSITSEAIDRGKNVTEWAKSPDCWAAVQTLDLELDERRIGALVDAPMPNVGAYREGGGSELTAEELRRQQDVMSVTADEYYEMHKALLEHDSNHGLNYRSWNAMKGCVQSMNTYALTGWTKIPSPKQTNQVMKARAFLAERES